MGIYCYSSGRDMIEFNVVLSAARIIQIVQVSDARLGNNFAWSLVIAELFKITFLVLEHFFG